MKEIAEKLAQVERELAEEKGTFLLFALFLREDATDLWDLLVSAPWLMGMKEKSLKYLVDKTKKVLKPHEMMKLSRIVIMEPDDPALEAVQKAFNIEHGMAEVKSSNFFGLQIKHAYIITSRREDHSAKK